MLSLVHTICDALYKLLHTLNVAIVTAHLINFIFVRVGPWFI